MIYCTKSPKYYLLTIACVVKDKLGLKKDCVELIRIFDVQRIFMD